VWIIFRSIDLPCRRLVLLVWHKKTIQMGPSVLHGLPVIHHETGYLLNSMIYLLASFFVILAYMVAGHRRKIPLGQLLAGAATFFLFFTLGSRLLAFTSGEWHQLLSHGAWPRAGNKTVLGGLAGLLAGVLLYASWTRNSKRIFDVVAIVLPAGMGIQRIGCLLSGCCAGIPTRLPWGIRYDQYSQAWNSQVISGLVTPADPCSVPVHPAQVYDIIAWVIIFYIAARAARYLRAPGSRLLLTILLYGLFRFLLEFLRDPLYDLIPGSSWGIRYMQLMILAGLPLPACLILAGERRAGKTCQPGVREEEKFARHLILALIVVCLFLMSGPLFNLPEMIAMSLLLVSLFIVTAIRVFSSDTVPGTIQGTILLLPGFVIAGISYI
jgi:prolipoprotein diacylglyceryltransferase